MSEQQETVESTPAAAPASSGGNNKGMLWGVVVVVLVLVGALVAYQQGYFGSMGSGDDTTGMEEPSSVDPSTPVASVNGAVITRGELDEKIAQIRKTIPDGVADPTQDASFEYSVLDEMINLKLLVTRAESQGIAVTDEQVEQEIKSLIDVFGGEENFNAQLTITGLTREQLAANMKNELLIRQLVDKETNLATVEVTEDEVKAAYDLAVAGSDATSTPSLEEVSEMLKANLLQQKSASIVDAYITDLKSGADIQNFL